MRLGERDWHCDVCRPTRLWLMKDQRVVAQDLRALEMSVDHSAFP
jgi:hypothetical protein